ncbi:MAG: hypothetical protein R3E39_23765 [Anaerolineae bacterium]
MAVQRHHPRRRPAPTNIYNDYYHFHWNFWWIRHALTTPGLNVYETNFVLFPFTTNLAYHTLTPFWYPLWALLEPLAGTFVAMFVIILLAMALSGYCTFLFLRAVGVPNGLALAGGALYQLTPAMLLAVMLSDINYVSLFWYPLLLLLWRRIAASYQLPVARFADTKLKPVLAPALYTGRAGEGFFTRHSILSILFFSLALYGLMMTDYQHLLFVAFLLIPYGLLTLWQAGSWAVRARLIGAGVAALLIATVLLWFVGPLPYILSFDRSSLSPMSIEQAQGIPFPLGYIGRFNTYDYRQITLGALLLPGLAIALMVYIWRTGYIPSLQRRWRVREAAHNGVPTLDRVDVKLPSGPVSPHSASNYRPSTINPFFWLLLAIPPLLLSAGATITIGGTTIATPYVAFHNLFGGLFRVPARFAPVIILPALVFIGLSLSPFFSGLSWRTWRLGGLICLIFLVFAESHTTGIMPIQHVLPHYDFYEQMGRESGQPYDDYVVFEIPTAGGTGEAWVGEFKNMQTQFYGMTHHKRMLNGSLARAPLDYYWYWLYDDPMIAWLGQRRFLETDSVEAQLRDRIYNWPIGYFVIHQDNIGRSGPTNQEIIGYFNSLDDLLCPMWVEGEAVVYRTAWHPDGCPPRTPPETTPGVYTIDIGSQGDERYIGWGWHYPEVVGGATTWRWTGEYPQTKLYVDLPAGDYTVSLSAQAFYEPRELRMLVNGTALTITCTNAEEACLLPTNAATIAPDSLQTLSFSLPANLVGTGRHLTFTLEYDNVVVPAEVGQGGDQRKLAVAVDSITFTQTGQP